VALNFKTMSKKIVIDKEVFEQKIEGWIERRTYVRSSDVLDILNDHLTEIDTDQSIEERAVKYLSQKGIKDYSLNQHDLSEFWVYPSDLYIKGATEQYLIDQMKAKEFAEWCSINGLYYSTASKGWHTQFHIHDFFTTEELFNKFTNEQKL